MMTRRSFVSLALAAGAYPLVMSSASAKTFVANGKVRLAAIGCGAQAWHDLQQFAKNVDLCEVVALCDTDIGANHTKKALETYPDLPRFQDFRKMFDEMADKIDAVLVGTPDHSHFCAAIHAMRLGKHVYVEKPLAPTFLQCELLMKAERETGVVCQLGNQGHSGDNYYQYRDYVKEGILKDVTKVVAHMNNGRRWHKWNGKVSSYPKAEKVPSTLDWDSWVSSAPYHDFSRSLAYGEWRSWYDYGLGCLGDWGAHILDTIHQFTLEGDLPTEIAISNCEGWNPYVFPMQDTLTMKFPKKGGHGDVTIEWYEGVKNLPKLPEGYLQSTEKGLFPTPGGNVSTVTKLNPGKEIYLADGTVWQGHSHGSSLRRCGSTDPVPKFEKSHNTHYRNFLLACRGEEEAKSPFRIGGTLSQVFTLGAIAQRLNRGIKFDPATKTVIGDEEANRLLKGPAPRKGWEVYYT